MSEFSYHDEKTEDCLDNANVSTKIMDKLAEYLTTRLDILIRWHETTQRGGNLYVFSEEMSGNLLGCFNHIIKKFYLKAWLAELDDGECNVRLNFCYEHPRGGSNGCDLDFTMTWNGTCWREEARS